MSALVALMAPVFVPARTVDPEQGISELEVGSPLNAGSPIAWQPANDAPARLTGTTGNQSGDPYIRLIPLIKPPNDLPRGGLRPNANKRPSRSGAGSPLTGA